MGTIAEKLTYLNDTKTAIKNAVIAKGVSVSDTDTFRSYADKIGQISGGGGAVTKFGVSIDNMLGNVDENGWLRAPTEPFVFDGTGIKNIYIGALGNRFYSDNSTFPIRITKILLPDLETLTGTLKNLATNSTALTEVDINKLSNISVQYAFQEAFAGCSNLNVIRMAGLVEISAGYACERMFSGCRSLKSTGLTNLTTISGDSTCRYMYEGCELEELGLDNLTEITGNYSCQYMFQNLKIDTATFPKLSTITGTTACRFMFGSSTVKQAYFPTLTNVVADAFGTSSSNAIFAACTGLLEIHFRADAQATIEALSAYGVKFGATNCTIYFDL